MMVHYLCSTTPRGNIPLLATSVGNFHGFRSFEKKFFSFDVTQEKENQTYLGMIRRVLDTPGFYYSNKYDLTHSIQRKNQCLQTKPNFLKLSLYERADERFVWNSHIMRDLVVQVELRRFIVPVVHGFISITNSTVNGQSFVFIVISRRSSYRAGNVKWV